MPSFGANVAAVPNSGNLTERTDVPRSRRSPNARTRVVVADRGSINRAGIRAILERSPSTAVVAEATSYEATLAAVEEHGPDVLVIDLDLGDDTTKGLEICEDVTQRLGIKVLVLAPTLSEIIVTEALRRGATGFHLKNEVSSDDLVKAVRAVQQGDTAFGRGVGALLSKALGQHRPETSGVSARELEIIKFVAQGLSNKQIAHQLFISESTVKFHLHNASKKLHAVRRAEIVHRASAEGLI